MLIMLSFNLIGNTDGGVDGVDREFRLIHRAHTEKKINQTAWPKDITGIQCFDYRFL